MSSKAAIRKKQQNRIFPLTEKKIFFSKSKAKDKDKSDKIVSSSTHINESKQTANDNQIATNIPEFNQDGPDPNELPDHLRSQLKKRVTSDLSQLQDETHYPSQHSNKRLKMVPVSMKKHRIDQGQELREYLNFCNFLMHQWNPENSGNLLKGYQINCTERALKILNQSNNDYTVAKFKILFPNSLLFDKNIIDKMSRKELQNLVSQTQQKYYQDKQNQKDICIIELLNHLKNRMQSEQFYQYLDDNQIQLGTNQISQQIKQHIQQSEQFSQKLRDLETPISLAMAEELFKQSSSILLVSSEMENFQSQWHKAQQLSQKIKELNNSSITLRGVISLIKEKKNIKIQIEGIAQLKRSHALALKWFNKASGYFKKVKPRASNYSITQILNINRGCTQESEIQVPDDYSQQHQQQMETIDDLINQAEQLQLQTFDVIKLKNDLVSIRAWESKVLMLMENEEENKNPQILQNFLQQGKQLKYSLPLIERLSSMINLNNWERRGTQLLSTTNNKIKKLEQLIDEGRQHNYKNQTMDRLIDLMNEINQFQQGLSQNFEKKLTEEKLNEMYQQCDQFQVTIQAKSVIGRRLADINQWKQKATASMNSTEQDVNLQKLKDLHDQWTVINVIVPQQERLRNIIYPTQGFVQKMKKLAKRYEKQANPQSKPGPKSKMNIDINFLVAFQKRPCAHQQCLEMIQQAPQIVKQDQQYLYLKNLMHEAAQWENQVIQSFNRILNKKTTAIVDDDDDDKQLQSPNVQETSQIQDDHCKSEQDQKQEYQINDQDSEIIYMKQILMKYKRYPIKRSIAAHVFRLYLIQEWKRKVEKSTNQNYNNLLNLNNSDCQDEQYSSIEECSQLPMEHDINQLMVLIKEGRNLCNQTTATFIEPLLAILKTHFEKLSNWMQLRQELNLQESQNTLIKTKNQSYYQRLSQSADNLRISGKFNCVAVIQRHYSKIQDWKRRCLQFFASPQKQPNLLQRLISQYNKLGVYLRNEIIPLRALQRCFMDWNNKVDCVLSIRCQHIIQYKINCVIELNPHNLSDRQMKFIPQQEQNSAQLYCICRMDDNNMKMIACDRCNSWFHMKCLLIQQNKYRRLQQEDFICPLCEQRYSQDNSRLSNITQNIIKQDNLLQYQIIDILLEEAKQLQIQFSPNLHLLKFMSHQIKNYYQKVERQLSNMKEVLRFSQIKEIFQQNGIELKGFKVIESIQEWQQKNSELQKLYLQGLGYPIRNQEQQEQILSILMQRDKIEEINKITQDNPGKFEQCFYFLKKSRLEKVAYSKYAKDYLFVIYEQLRNLADDHWIISSTIQKFLRDGGRASEAKEILNKARQKNVFNSNCVKLMKMLQQYGEWSKVVKNSLQTKDLNMIELEKLIEKGMFLYLYENQNKILQKLHENCKSWRNKAKSFIMSYSSTICHDREKFYLCQEKLDEVQKLIEYFHQNIQLKLNQIEKLEEIKSQLSNTIKHKLAEDRKQSLQ